MSSPTTSLDQNLDAARLIDREVSWLRFNERVLEEAADPTVPLLRHPLPDHLPHQPRRILHDSPVRYPATGGGGCRGTERGWCATARPAGADPRLRARDPRRGWAVETSLLDELAKQDVEVVHFADLHEDEQSHWSGWFAANVLPILTPLAVSPTFPFPFISNLSLNLALFVTDPQGERRLARVKIPNKLPRLLRCRAREGHRTQLFPIEELVAANLEALFQA